MAAVDRLGWAIGKCNAEVDRLEEEINTPPYCGRLPHLDLAGTSVPAIAGGGLLWQPAWRR